MAGRAALTDYRTPLLFMRRLIGRQCMPRWTGERLQAGEMLAVLGRHRDLARLLR